MNMPLSLTRATPDCSLLSEREAALAALVVDDEDGCREEIADALERRGLAVLTAPSAEDALRLLAARPEIGALVTDIRMPGTDGIALAETALAGRDAGRALEVVLVTGYVAPGHALAAERLGACSLLTKPVRGAALGRIVEDALDRAAARRLAAGPRAAAVAALLGDLATQAEAGTPRLAALAGSLRPAVAALPDRTAAAEREATRRALALMEDLLAAAAMQDGTLPPLLAPVSAHALAGSIAGRLAALGIACGRRITLQPDADLAYRVDTQGLLRAIALLGGATLRVAQGPATADLSVDAGAGEARLDLVIRPALPREAGGQGTDRSLPLAIARRLVAAQGGRLDAWLLPEGVLRARLFLPGA